MKRSSLPVGPDVGQSSKSASIEQLSGAVPSIQSGPVDASKDLEIHHDSASSLEDGVGPELEDASTSPTPLVSSDLPISPSEDVRTYGIWFIRWHLILGFPCLTPPKIVDDVVFDVIQAQLSSAVAIPIMKIMLEAAQYTWSKLSSVPISCKRLDHVYQTQEKSAAFFFHHPSLNSLVVLSAAKGH